MAPQFNEVIKDENALREIFGHPSKMNVNKEIPILDEHCRAFIARSPYMLLASSDADGNLDISPKGDPPGFVHILNDHAKLVCDIGELEELQEAIEKTYKVGLY